MEASQVSGVRITSPDKVYFPDLGITKREVIEYYREVGEAALRALQNRPILLKRFPNGIQGDFFYQKRAPRSRPSWVPTATFRFPSGRSADHVVVDRLETLVWLGQIGNIELHAHPVRAADLDHPDELRVDLDPGPGVEFSDVKRVAVTVRQVLEDHGLSGWPKTSGGRGLHVYARIEPRWGFSDVRRAALALAREVATRDPEMATSRWWKEERHGVFVDYNQNARDRTMAAAYSLRASEDARVSMPFFWDELPEIEPERFTIHTAPGRLHRLGDPFEGIDDAVGSLESLLELAEVQGQAGAEDAPWPPHFPKGEGEPTRAAPSRARAPLLTVARAAREDEALGGLERWKQRHPEAAGHLREEDVLVDSMRGRYTTWTRIRLNLRHVPRALRPPAEKPDPDFTPT